MPHAGAAARQGEGSAGSDPQAARQGGGGRSAQEEGRPGQEGPASQSDADRRGQGGRGARGAAARPASQATAAARQGEGSGGSTLRAAGPAQVERGMWREGETERRSAWIGSLLTRPPVPLRFTFLRQHTPPLNPFHRTWGHRTGRGSGTTSAWPA